MYHSFEDRKVRDECFQVSAGYKPPIDFVVNAMQVLYNTGILPYMTYEMTSFISYSTLKFSAHGTWMQVML